MAINRGYRPAEQVIMDDWYEPSMEMLAQVGSMAQQQQDKLAAQLAKIGESQFNYLQKDYEKANAAYADIYKNINKLAEGAMGDGDLRSVRGEIDRYTRDLSRRFSPHGDIGAMQANYQAYTKWAEEVDKMAQKEYGKDGITNKHAMAIKNYVLNNYAGIGDQDPRKGYNKINLENPAVAVDLTKITEELGKGYIADSYKNAEIDPKTGQIRNGAMWRDNGKIWRKTGTGKTEVRADDVFKDLMYGLTKHEGYRQYLDQQKLLGLSQYGMEDIYVDALDPTTGETKRVLNEGHPIVQEAKRGASKFGFQQLEFSDDIKFDPYDLAVFESGLRMKEENNKKSFMVFETTSKERTFTHGELTENLKLLKDSKTNNTKLIETLQQKLNNARNSNDPDAIKLAEKQLMDAQREKERLIVQESMAMNRIAKMEKAGGLDYDAEAKKLGVSKSQYLKIMRGEVPFPSSTATNIGKGGIPVTVTVAQPGWGEAKERYDKSVKKGENYVAQNVEQRSIFIPNEHTRASKNIAAIKTKLANGAVNFISEDGTSFNDTDLSNDVATGNIELNMLTSPVNGKVGWELVITEKGKKAGADKRFRNMVGTIEGPENDVMMMDIAVELQQAAEAKGMATPKAQQELALSRMIIGAHAAASTPDGSLTGSPTGAGTVHNQVINADINNLDEGETSDFVYLPNGLAAKFMSTGDGVTFFPQIYKVSAQGPGRGFTRVLDADAGIPGAMSMEDFYSWLGELPSLHPGITGPKYVNPAPTVQGGNTTNIYINR